MSSRRKRAHGKEGGSGGESESAGDCVQDGEEEEGGQKKRHAPSTLALSPTFELWQSLDPVPLQFGPEAKDTKLYRVPQGIVSLATPPTFIALLNYPVEIVVTQRGARRIDFMYKEKSLRSSIHLFCKTKEGYTMDLTIVILNTNFFGHVQGLRDAEGPIVLRPGPLIYETEEGPSFSCQSFYDGDMVENAKHPEKYWRSLPLECTFPRDVVVSMGAKLVFGTFWTEDEEEFVMTPTTSGPEVTRLVIDATASGAWRLNGTYRTSSVIPAEPGAAEPTAVKADVVQAAVETAGVQAAAVVGEGRATQEDTFVLLTPPPSPRVTKKGKGEEEAVGSSKDKSPKMKDGMSLTEGDTRGHITPPMQPSASPVGKRRADAALPPSTGSTTGLEETRSGAQSHSNVALKVKWTGQEDDCVRTGKRVKK